MSKQTQQAQVMMAMKELAKSLKKDINLLKAEQVWPAVNHFLTSRDSLRSIMSAVRKKLRNTIPEPEAKTVLPRTVKPKAVKPTRKSPIASPTPEVAAPIPEAAASASLKKGDRLTVVGHTSGHGHCPDYLRGFEAAWEMAAKVQGFEIITLRTEDSVAILVRVQPCQ